MPNNTNSQRHRRKYVILSWRASSPGSLPSGNTKLIVNIINLSQDLHFEGKDVIYRMTELKFTSLHLPFSALQAAARATK